MKKGISFLLCKITVLLMLFSFCSISLAGGPDTPPPPNFDGFYIVGGAGAEMLMPTNVSYRQRGTGGEISRAFIKIASKPKWYGSPFMRVGLEWGHVFQISAPDTGMYVGFNTNFRTGGRWHNANARFFGLLRAALPVATGYTDVSMNENYLFDGLFKLGYAWHTYLAYFQLGAGAGNLTFDNRSFSSLVAGFQSNPNQWAPAYLAGLGFEALLTPKLIFGVDYMYTRYASISVLAAMDAVGGAGNAPVATQGILHGALQSHRVGVYLKYKLSL